MPVTRATRRPAGARAGAGAALLALVLVTGVGPLATDAYMPALPALQTSFGTTAAMAQLTLTAFIVGQAIGQLLFGPVSDGIGRRPIILGSAVLFLLTSLLCAVAPTPLTLIVARLVQGLVVGAGVAAGMASVSDRWSGVDADKQYGTLAAVNLLAPVIAPPLGSIVLAFGTWRDVFVALAALGVLMLAAALLWLPESLAPERRGGSGPRASAARIADLGRDRSYMAHVVTSCLAVMGFFAYIGGSSFVLQEVYGIGEGTYAAVFTVNAAAMVITSTTFRLTVERVGAYKLRRAGLALAFTGSALTLLVGLLGPFSLPAAWAPLTLVTAGMGLVLPSSTALGQAAGRRASGTAAALLGGLSFLTGALITPLTGVLGSSTLIPMAALMTGFLALAVLAGTRAQPPSPSSSGV